MSGVSQHERHGCLIQSDLACQQPLTSHGRCNKATAKAHRTLLLGLVTLLAFLTAATTASASSTLQVNAVSGNDAGDCQTTPCATLSYAVTQATLASGPVIIDAAAGIYKGDLTLSETLNGLTIVGAGSSGDPASNTIIEGVSPANTLDATTMSTLTIEHVRMINSAGDDHVVIYAHNANVTLTDVAIEQHAANADTINSDKGSITLDHSSININDANSDSYAIDQGSYLGSVLLHESTIDTAGGGYGIDTRGEVSSFSSTINLTNPDAAGYAINAGGEVFAEKTDMTVAGDGYALNTTSTFDLAHSTINLTNPNGYGYGINSTGGGTAIYDAITVAGEGYGINASGDIMLTGSTIELTNPNGHGYGVNTSTLLAAIEAQVTIAGNGYGLNSGHESSVSHSTVDLTNPEGYGYAVNCEAGLSAAFDKIMVAGTGSGVESERGELQLTSSTVELTNPESNGVGARAGLDAAIHHSTITVAGQGSALSSNGSATIEQSTLVTGPISAKPTVQTTGISGDHSVLISHSIVRQEMHPEPMIEAEAVNMVIENSLLVEGSGVLFTASGGETYDLTVAASTIDAGEAAIRDTSPYEHSIVASVDYNPESKAIVSIEGSILIESPTVVLPVFVSRPVRRTTPVIDGVIEIDCSHTETPNTSKIETGWYAINCATGSDGNIYTPALADIFSDPASGYTLKQSWVGVDAIPADAITLPAGLVPSTTDLPGKPRIANGKETCLKAQQDMGAYELTGKEGTPPAPAISGPETTRTDTPAEFGAHALQSATFQWESSDGATATGVTFTHAFSKEGIYTITLTATGHPACTATVKQTVTVKNPPPQPHEAPKPQPAVETQPQPPPPVTAAQLALTCANTRVTLTDVVIEGDHVLLTGAAEGKLTGKPVTILFDKRTRVATTIVRADGLFTATAPLPPVNVRYSNRARYQAHIGALHSRDLKLTRRLILDPPASHDGRVTLQGKILPPLARPTTTIQIWREGSNCTHPALIARIRPGNDGRYAARIHAPAQPTVYRLTANVRATRHNIRTYHTYSLTETTQPSPTTAGS